MNGVTVIGCGDIGLRVAALWQARGLTVTALARSAAAAARLRAAGIEPVSGDLDQPESLAGLDVAGQLVYYLAPPPPAGQTDPRMHAFLDALSRKPAPGTTVYLSTTGVYGDCHGAWVDEHAAVDPKTPRGRRRLDAENALRAWGRRYGVAVIILRVPGIYGPGRLPLDAVRARRPVVRESECGFSNRIHADDLARACVAAGERGQADTIYNASDGRPGTMTEYFNSVADCLGLQRPPVVNRSEAGRFLSADLLSYIDESRRISNRRIIEELGVQLLYPDLRTGLAACLASPGKESGS